MKGGKLVSLFSHSHTHCQCKYKYLDCTARPGHCLLIVYPGSGHNKLFYRESYLRLAPPWGNFSRAVIKFPDFIHGQILNTRVNKKQEYIKELFIEFLYVKSF